MKSQFWCSDYDRVLDKVITNALFHFHEPAIWLQSKLSMIISLRQITIYRSLTSNKNILESYLLYFLRSLKFGALINFGSQINNNQCYVPFSRSCQFALTDMHTDINSHYKDLKEKINNISKFYLSFFYKISKIVFLLTLGLR